MNGKKTARAGSLMVLMLLMVLAAASPAIAAPGEVDTSFGDDGTATIKRGPTGATDNALAADKAWAFTVKRPLPLVQEV